MDNPLTERRYTLHEITGAMGEALKTLSFEERSEHSRVLRLFVDRTVDRLKAPSIVDAVRLMASAVATHTVDDDGKPVGRYDLPEHDPLGR